MDNGDQQARHEPWRPIPRKNAPTATAASQVEPATLRIPSATADPSSHLPSQPNDPAGSEPKLRLLPFGEARKKLKYALGFAKGQTVEGWLESKVADCGEETRAHWKGYLKKMLKLIYKGFRAAYDHLCEHPPTIQRITAENANETGVYKFNESPHMLDYMVKKHLGEKEDPTAVCPAELADLASKRRWDPRGKVGRTTRSVEIRVAEQLGELRDMGLEASACASMILLSKQIDEMLDLPQFDFLLKALVELVKSNSIPKIACHKDKQALALRILKDEFFELVVMSASFGYTYAGGEVIFAVPSAELEKLFEPSTYSPNIVERLKNTVSIDLFRTWKTFSSSIDAMLSEDSIPTETQAVIRNNFDGEENRTFVQNYLQRLVRLKTRTRSLVPWMQSRFLSPLE